jgi:hypothetical protein
VYFFFSSKCKGGDVVDLVLTARCHATDRVVYPRYAKLNTISLTHTLVSTTYSVVNGQYIRKRVDIWS